MIRMFLWGEEIFYGMPSKKRSIHGGFKMTDSKLTKKDSTRKAYIEQARARLAEVKRLDGRNCDLLLHASDPMRREMTSCNVDVGMYIRLAEVEIDLLEHADENEWGSRRRSVDSAVGKAVAELERSNAILKVPK